MLHMNDLYKKKLDSQRSKAIGDMERRIALPLATLDEDLSGGFGRAVRNGQSRLALEYLVEIVEALGAQITELQDLLASNSVDTKEEPKPRKVVKATPSALEEKPDPGE